MLAFRGEGKLEYPEKTSRCREENQQTEVLGLGTAHYRNLLPLADNLS